MKKYFIATAVLAFMPAVALASWWNPTTWSTSQVADQSNQVSVLVAQIASLQQTITQQNSEISSLNNTILSLSSTTQPATIAAAAKVTTITKYLPCTTASSKPTISTTPVPTTTAVSPLSALMSLDSSNPTGYATSTNGYYSGPVLVFNVQPSSAGQSLNSLTVQVDDSGVGNTNLNNVGSVSLYVGDEPSLNNPIVRQEIATAPVINGSATFSNIPTNSQVVQNLTSLRYPSNNHNVFTILANVSNDGSQTVSVSVTDVKVVDSNGHNINVSGSAQGNSIPIINTRVF